MFPKKGQVWTYRDRTKTLGVLWSIPVILGLTLGTYIGVTEGDWLVFGAAILALVGVVTFVMSNLRHYRNDP